MAPEQNDIFPLVSIALATYNGAAYLPEQLDSLIAQTYPNIEIVVSDDGSSDATHDIIKDYQEKHPQLFFYLNKNGSGIRNNFENAMRHCKGYFIALCDQDDVWLPQKIETLVKNIGQNDMVYHNSLFIDEQGNSLQSTIAGQYNCYEGNDPQYFVMNNCISGHACMFRADLLKKALPLPNARYHDWWLAFVAASGKGIAYLPAIFVHYRQHQASKTDILKRRKDYKHAGMDIKFRQELEWYNRCAAVEGPDQPFFIQWRDHYAASEQQWFCPWLFFTTLKKRKAFFYIVKKTGAQAFIEALKQLPGLRLKKWLSEPF